MADVCPSCKSNALTTDEHGGQSHRVCTACGEVIDSVTSFEQDRDYWSGVTSCNAAGSFGGATYLGKYRSIRQSDPSAPKRTLRPWLSYIREVCGVMKLTAEMERGVLDLFTRAFQGALKFKQRERKRALCAAALYTVCRQHNWPVSLSDISAVVQSALNDVFAMKQLLASELNIWPAAADIEDIVEQVLKKYGLEDQTFVAKTVKVVGLAKDTWITSGRSRDPAICAAAFLVWKSSPEGRRKGSKLLAFSQRLRTKPPPQTTQRVKEIRDILVRLAGQLPWLRCKTVTQDMATLHLDDILRYKRYLISHVEPPREVGDSESDSDGETRHSEHRDGVSNSRPTRPSPAAGRVLPPSWNRIRKRKLNTCDDSSDTESPSKRQGMASPVENLPDEGSVSMDKELTDRDIPESEMHLYVRSESEVAALERLQERVMAQENTARDRE